LGLENHHLRDHLRQRRRFFDNKERLQKLQTLVTSNDTAVDLDRKMLAVVVKADQPELFTILRTLFHTWTDIEDTDAIDLSTPPPCWDLIEKFDLAHSFWHMIQTTFGYQEDTPSLRNLLIRLLVTDYAGHLHGDVPQSLAHLLLHRLRHALRALAHRLKRAPLRFDRAVGIALAKLALGVAHRLAGRHPDASSFTTLLQSGLFTTLGDTTYGSTDTRAAHCQHKPPERALADELRPSVGAHLQTPGARAGRGDRWLPAAVGEPATVDRDLAAGDERGGV
jgi:hypothetical protein